MRYLLLFVILAVILLTLTVLVYLADRTDKRREERARETVKALSNKNPDAGWLYGQGLSPEEIEFAVKLRNGIK